MAKGHPSSKGEWEMGVATGLPQWETALPCFKAHGGQGVRYLNVGRGFRGWRAQR